MLPVMYHKVNRKKRLRSPAKTGFRNFGFYRKIQLKNETSLDKGTQRKTTENELPSLTQCTA